MCKNSKVMERMFESIKLWQQSGLSKKAYCEQHGIKVYSFYYWYKVYSKQHSAEDAKASSFVKLKIEKPATTAPVEIYFPGGIRLAFHEAVSAAYIKFLVS